MGLNIPFENYALLRQLRLVVLLALSAACFLAMHNFEMEFVL
jgi:hypothetical protein